MSEPIELILNGKNQLLRITCGQCGDTKDFMFDIDPELGLSKIIVSICDDPEDLPGEENPACLCKPIHLIV